MAKRKATAKELEARAESSGYKREAHLIGIGGRGNHIYMIDLGLATYHNSTRTVSPGAHISKHQRLSGTSSVTVNSSEH
jgi:hypothetical protein